MPGWFSTLNPAVQAAIVAGLVAVFGSLVGAITALVVQRMTADKSHQNALDLFEKQAEEQNRVQAEQAKEQRRLALIADRRAAYTAFVRLMDLYQTHAHQAQERYEWKLALEADDNSAAKFAQDSYFRSLDRANELLPQLVEARDVLDLIATDPARQAASVWYAYASMEFDAAKRLHHPQPSPWIPMSHQEARQLRVTFLDQARTDLGASDGPQHRE